MSHSVALTNDQWWKNHAEQFPLMAGLVRVVFGVPVASSKSERVFSILKVKNIVMDYLFPPFLKFSCFLA